MIFYKKNSNSDDTKIIFIPFISGFNPSTARLHGEGECPARTRRYPIGDGEVGYGSQVLVAWLDFCVGNLEPGKLHLVLCEAEFVGIQGDAVAGADIQPLCGLVESVYDGGGP